LVGCARGGAVGCVCEGVARGAIGGATGCCAAAGWGAACGDETGGGAADARRGAICGDGDGLSGCGLWGSDPGGRCGALVVDGRADGAEAPRSAVWEFRGDDGATSTISSQRPTNPITIAETA
jgi:hypothetical protein